MGIAGGIDLGGTKIEAQVFDDDWRILDKRRVNTPSNYPELVAAIVDQVLWLRNENPGMPVGIATAGLINPTDGTAIAANLASNGKPFPSDVDKALESKVTWLNDCRAFSLAEAVFGAGSKQGVTLGLVLGTGIGGAVTIDGRLINDGKGQSGEFGHMPLPAWLVTKHNLPLVTCGCGRTGCYETLGSGTGAARLARHMTGREIDAKEIAKNHETSAEIAKIWEVWTEVNAAMIQELAFVVEPQTVVLGGGVSLAPGLVEALHAHLEQMAWPGFRPPTFRHGTRGETAAALGAGFAAWQENSDD